MTEPESSNKTNSKADNEAEFDLAMKRLPKRLVYILRYGAVKEGLEVDENGFVELDELMKVPLLQNYKREDVIQDIKTSVGYRLVHRYNWREKDGKFYVRASYSRNFEKNPYHRGTQICTLFESAMTYILGHLDDYDLQDFPDEHIIRTMIHRLKRQKKLSTKMLRALLVPTLTSLDLEDAFLTNNVLRAIWTQCPHLTAVSFKNCGYIVTDSVLAQVTKNLPQLQKLNLSNCSHLTTKCLVTLARNLPHLQVLHIARVPSLTYETVLDFITSATDLKFLDVYNLNTSPEEFNILKKAAQEKGLNLVLKERCLRKAEQVEEEKNVQSAAVGADDDDIDEGSSEGSQPEMMYDVTVEDLWAAEPGNVWYESYDYTYTDDEIS